MRRFKYIFLSFLLLIGSFIYSQNNLITPAPLVRYNLLYDGIDEFSNIDNALINVLTTTITGTWSCWVKLVDATPSGAEQFIAFGDASDTEMLRLLVNTDGTMSAQARFEVGGNQWVLSTVAAVFSDNTWTHAAIVQNGTASVLYIDAVAVGQTFVISTDKTVWFNDFSGLDNGRIAALNFNGTGETGYLNGNIEEVSFWDAALSQPEIAEIYNNNRPTNLRTHSKIANLVAWYQQGEFSSFSSGEWNIVDASINNNPAITVNMEFADRILTTLNYAQPTGALKVGNNLIISP